MDEIIKREDALFKHISKLIDEAHKHVKTTVNTAMVYTYYGVGKYIVEDEQTNKERAAYGKGVLKQLAVKLNTRSIIVIIGITWHDKFGSRNVKIGRERDASGV